MVFLPGKSTDYFYSLFKVFFLHVFAFSSVLKALLKFQKFGHICFNSFEFHCLMCSSGIYFAILYKEGIFTNE